MKQGPHILSRPTSPHLPTEETESQGSQVESNVTRLIHDTVQVDQGLLDSRLCSNAHPVAKFDREQEMQTRQNHRGQGQLFQDLLRSPQGTKLPHSKAGLAHTA